MSNQRQPQISLNENKAASFPAPFGRDEFKLDIVEAFFMQVRSIAWMTNPKTAWAITGLPYNDSVNDLTSFEFSASHYGIKYEDICETNFASVLTQIYDYAYLGCQDMSKELMEDESSYA